MRRPLFWLIIGILLAVASVAFAADNWTMAGGGVYWNNSIARISVYPATSHNPMTQEQYVNFSYFGATPKTVNLTFLFDKPITAGTVSLLQNVTSTYYTYYQGRENYTLNALASNFSLYAGSAPCEVGDALNALKYNVTFSNSTVRIVCFNSQTHIADNYTISYSLNATLSIPHLQTKPGWVDISGKFTANAHEDYRLYTINNVDFTNGTLYQTKFMYDTPFPLTSGKFSIYVHAGSPAMVLAHTAPVYIELDPWWNSTNVSNSYWYDGEDTLWINASLTAGTIWRYAYGNCTKASETNGTNVFPAFEDCANTLDTTTKWAATNSPTCTNGQLQLDADAAMYYKPLVFEQNCSTLAWANVSKATGAVYPPGFINGTSVHIVSFLSVSLGTNWLARTYITSASDTDTGVAVGAYTGFKKLEVWWQNGRAVFYINGILKVNKTTNVPTDTTLPFYVGNGGSSNTAYYKNLAVHCKNPTLTPTIQYGTVETGAFNDGHGATCGYRVEFNVTSTAVQSGYQVELNYTKLGGNLNMTVTDFYSGFNPVIVSSSISPTPNAYKNDTLLGYCKATDSDSATLRYSFKWFVNGTLNSTGTSGYYANNTLANIANITPNHKGQQWQLECTANDGALDSGALNSSNTTILNSLPNTGIPTLSPIPAYKSTANITCTNGSTNDTDGDTVTFTYLWFLNGTTTGITTRNISNASFGNGDKLVCQITPNDGTSNGASQNSSSLTIANTPPMTGIPTLSPIPAYKSTANITCTNGSTNDTDGDTVTFTYLWFLNGTTTGITTRNISNASFSKNGALICQITPNDGAENGTAQNSSALVISNSAPVTGTPSITPIPVYQSSTSANCGEGATTDADSDTVTFTYLWYKNGQSTGTTTKALSNFTVGDVLLCSITPFDGTVSGAMVNSAPVTVQADYLWKALNLSTGTENLTTSPQAIIFDANNLNAVIYFTNDSAAQDNLHIRGIYNNLLNYSLSTPLNRTKNFMLAMRENGYMRVLTFSKNNTGAQFINFTSGSVSIINVTTADNVGNNLAYNPYTYANTKGYETPFYTPSGYYLFWLPISGAASKLMRINQSSTAMTGLNTTVNSAAVAWSTIANDSALSTWYFPNTESNGATAWISIYYYDGTEQTKIARPDSTDYSAAQLANSLVYMQGYQQKTYAFITNATTNRAVIHCIEDNITLVMNETIASPSHFLFADNKTFIFFNTVGTSVTMYSIYFNTDTGIASYTSMPFISYGFTVPTSGGFMSASRRANGYDYVTAGLLSGNTAPTTLTYMENKYDAQFICYDEHDEYRKTFTSRVYTGNTSATVLGNATWGWVVPASLLGTGQKRAYSTGQNGTTRMLLESLNSEYKLDAYSLNTWQGAYYTFTIKNQYGAVIQGATATAQRFSIKKQQFVAVEQGISDYNGQVTFFLEPLTPYRVLVSANGYVVITFDFVPASTTAIQVNLQQTGNTTATLPDWKYAWGDISYLLQPSSTRLYNSSITANYTVSSASGALQYQGMKITRTYNGTSAVVFNSNITGFPTGTLQAFTCNITSPGTYRIETWFKHQDYGTTYLPTVTILIGPASNLQQASQLFSSGGGQMSGWGYYFMAVIAAMFVAGFVAQYTIAGAGVAGLLVLWIASLFYPNAEVVCLSEGACLTPPMITAFTTLMVMGAWYLMQQNM